MLYRILDLEYSARLGRIDAEPLERLLHGKEVLGITERFYVVDGRPHLVVGVRFRLPRLATPGVREKQTAEGREPGDPSLRQLVSEADWPLFETLRSWRLARARQEAVPPYVILTNQQLAQVTTQKPRSLSALDQIPGFGKSRRERFGEELIELLHGKDPSQACVDDPLGPLETGPGEGGAQP